MRAHGVDAHQGVPGGEPHAVFKVEVVSADAEQFAQAARPVVLVGDGGHDLGVVRRVIAQS